MATAAEMGEIDEVHTKDDDVALNGEVANKADSRDTDNEEDEPMEVDSVCDTSKVNDSEEQNGEDDIEDIEDANSVNGNSVETASSIDESSQDIGNNTEENSDEEEEEDEDVDEEEENGEEGEEEESPEKEALENEDVNSVESDRNLEPKDDNGPVDSNETNTQDGTIELNDSGEDVMIVDSDIPAQNGKEKDSASMAVDLSDEPEVINLDTPIKKKKNQAQALQVSPRRSSRNLNKQKSYVETDKEEEEYPRAAQSDESDIEEVLPEDPLAVGDSLHGDKFLKKSRNSSPAIVVKDTKRLVEIAAKSSPNTGGKKEPTLVIIDTNSILSGRGPVPLLPSTKPQMLQRPSQMPSSKSVTSYPILPMALPAQGIYPPNMRATITPIPMNTAPASQTAPSKPTAPPPPAPVLPTLTDDMFVVEAPSFIVPYVYEKPPIKDLNEFIKEVQAEILDQKKKEEENKSKSEDGEKKEERDDAKSDTSESLSKEQRETDSEDRDGDELEVLDPKKPYSYFNSPLGKFFIDIGYNLVQEFVQTDLLRQQKRKRDREGGQNRETNKTIMSLIKDLELTKENNEPYKMETKKCEFCSFKTESSLAMAFHLETPHMKNFVYRCNFCPYEVRSPHDILFHMEAEHAVRGRLERAPAFHQCPNCPFEDNQKGKLSRHLVACTRKFKPERNLEPPVDWEPPAKIPRVPRMKQNNLNAATSVYQALAKSPQQQYQMFSKIQTNSMMHRGRGRPSLGTSVISKQQSQQSMIRTPTGMVYKQAMAGGGSVLVPTSYQLSGNQVYQVVGGQELGGRIGPVGPMAFVPNMSAASSLTIQQQNSNKQTKPVHQPSISITPLPRTTAAPASAGSSKPGDSSSKNSFVICEICDGYIKDLEQLRNHMQWIHKVKIHPKMIYNRPPLNCQKCQFRFFTDQGLERHLLGSHGLVTSSMQEAANKSKDAGRCPVCGRVYQWKLLNHVARDHNMTLKPAHLSYKCTVCTATFGMYKQFENHVYSAHSTVAKRVMDKKTPSASAPKNDTLLKPLKINDEITIIPQPTKSASSAGT